ncbi:MAG: dynamin family protein [Desulfatirhabdiaceae bacterium]
MTDKQTLPDLLEQGIRLMAGLKDGTGRKADEMTALRDRLLEGRFHLAVLGQFKRGKSTLLNALVGEPILPVSVIPLTSIPTFIQFDETPLITVGYANGKTREQFSGGSLDERTAFLAQRVTEEGNPNNNMGVNTVEVGLTSPLLARGVTLIDTPGIGSTYHQNTRSTLDFLEQCDAALFLVSADLPITDAEVEFLRQVRAHIPRLFFVLNKIDCLGEKERNKLLSFFRKTLANQLEIKNDFPIYCVSARLGLDAKIQNNNQLWQESGMENLENHLIDFLICEKFSALSQVIARRAQNIIESALMQIRISLESLQLPGDLLQEKIRIFEKSLQQASQERNIIQDILEGDKKRLTAFLEDTAVRLREEASESMKDIMMKGTAYAGRRSGKEGIQAEWSNFLPQFFDAKNTELTKEIQERLLDSLTPHKQRIGNLVELLRKTAAELFRIPYRPLNSETVLKSERKPYWVLNTWNTAAAPVLLSMESRMDDLLRRNVENLRWNTLQNIIVAFSRFSTELKQRLEETVASTKGAMEAAHQCKKDHGETVAEEISKLEIIIHNLESVKSHLTGVMSEPLPQ